MSWPNMTSDTYWDIIVYSWDMSDKKHIVLIVDKNKPFQPGSHLDHLLGNIWDAYRYFEICCALYETSM